MAGSALSSHDGLVLTLDRDGTIVAVNEAYGRQAALHGLPSCIGQSYLAICRSDPADPLLTAERAAEGIHAVLDRRESFFFLEYSLPDGAGDEAWYKLMCLPRSLEACDGAVVSHHVIAARKAVEQQLRASERRWNQARQLTGLGARDYDLEKGRAVWTDEVFAVFGLLPAQGPLPLRSFDDNIHPDDRAGYRRTMADASWDRMTLVYRWLGGDSTMRNVKSSFLRERAGDGAVVRLFAVDQDVTAAAHAEAALRSAKEAAEIAAVARTRFAATVSHEIRTPMTGLLAMTELLLATDLDPRQRGYAEVIGDSAQALLGIVNDTIDIARLDEGRIAIRPRDVALQPLLSSVVSLWRPAAEGKGLTLVLDIAPTLSGFFAVDDVRLRQILNNLLSNAVKFSESGCVRLTAGHKVLGASDVLMIAVQDNGPGVPESMKHAIFEPFEQGETRQRAAGSGLGLAIAKRLAELMGGSLRLEHDAISADGSGGACFTFEIQVRRVAAPAATPAPGSDAGSARPHALAVLVADDNATNRLVFRTVLEAGGHKVVTAVNGQDALDAAGREPFDIILLDVFMPVMTGPDAAARIRAGDGPNRDTPIIAMTAGTTEAVRAEDAGIDAVLMKPVTPAALLACVGAQARPRQQAA